MTEKVNKTVLIVDDEADVIRFLQMALEDAGFDVVLASNGVEALEKVKEQVPDLISLDIVMPKGSGVKFHRDLKKNSEWSRIPVIIVSGHARDDEGKADFQEMTLSGPGVYLEKPVTAESYVKAVRRVLGLEKLGNLPEAITLKDEVRSLIESADTDTLKEIYKAIQKKEQDKAE
ncbi:response regulator [Planctomycetota bacterium]